ncbi:MAG: hypothetical protein IPK03_01170 [Bacteroidetes bacterium]|nr:hypothetical protein [Bacteroidota bacterium]
MKVTNDNVAFYVTGFSTDSTIDFDPGAGISKTPALPNGDVVVAKYLTAAGDR